MAIEIKEILTKKDWDSFLETDCYLTMFLSWEWIEFERTLGHKIIPYGVFNDDTLVGLMPVKYIPAKRGKYLHLRHAPLINWNDADVVKKVIEFMKKMALAAKYDFIRISPLILPTEENYQLLKSYGFIKSKIHSTDAELTVVIDLNKSIDEIFNEMKKSARNMIRKAEKLDLVVKHCSNFDLFEDFFKVYSDTLSRNKWTAYNLNYIKKELATFQKTSSAEIFVTYSGDIPISGAIFIKHRGSVVYHFGGSASKFRDIPSSYLLHWTAIKKFKEQGVTEYNFWGVCPEGNKKHPWYGFSQFKRSFTSIEKEHIHSHDYDITFKAKLTHLYELLESRLRGYN